MNGGTMKRLIPILLLAALLVPANPVQASSYVDSACMKAEAQAHPNLTTAQRRSRCTVTVTITSRKLPSERHANTQTNGFFGWNISNFLWSATISVWFHAKQVCPPLIGCKQTDWVIDNVDCVKGQVLIVSLSIDSCPANGWRLSGTVQRAGVFFTTGFGPVSEGQHSYFLLTDPNSVSGLIEGTN